MRLFTLSLMAFCAVFVGCNQPVESLPNVGGSSSTTETQSEESAFDEADVGEHEMVEEAAVEEAPVDESASLEPAAVRFVADKSLSVPGMHCPDSCYPAIEKALASVPGVEAVQLAEQPDGTPEGTIETKVVELKLGEGFDIESALAALKAASFEGEVLN